jgi:transposase
VDEVIADASQLSLIQLTPLPGIPLGRRLQLLDDDGRRAIFIDAAPLHIFDAEDRLAEAAAIALLTSGEFASQAQMATAFGRHRNTISRLNQRLQRGGMPAVLPAKRGPKGPHKVTPAVWQVIEESAELGCVALAAKIQERTGVGLSAAHVSRLQKQLRARPSPTQQPQLWEEAELLSPEPSESAPAQTLEATPETSSESVLEPPVVLPQAARGRYMGAALYYPALQVLDLLRIAADCFRLAASERFGIRATTLTLFFLALLDLPTVEAAKYLRRGEFGALIGTPRAPSVKTLRRKLAELLPLERSMEFGQRLARRLVEQSQVATATLYVDGHMKVYSGKRKLGKTWNTQRRLPLPGFNSFYVGDLQGRPLLFINQEAGVSLSQAMPDLVKAIREVLGDRRFTIVFDRGGFDAKLFEWLDGEGIDFITYQVGSTKLAAGAFHRHRVRLDGRWCYLHLAEDQVKVNRRGPWRRIVVLRPDGYQLPILTNGQAPPTEIVLLADRRWRQENFSKYMRQHKGLDQIASYQFEEVSGDRLLPNPARGQLQGQIRARARELKQLRADLGKTILQEPGQDHIAKASPAITALQDQLAELRRSLRNAPSHVPANQAGDRNVLKLEQKTILDRFKLTAYQAEQWMLDRLLVHYPNPHDAHAMLRDFAQLSGDMRFQQGRIQITLDPPDTPSHRRALEGLCAELTQYQATFPGTDIPVEYQVAVHHSQAPI